MSKTQRDRRPYLSAIPPSEKVQERLAKLLAEMNQLKILLRTAEELERDQATLSIAGEAATAVDEPANQAQTGNVSGGSDGR